MKKVSLETKENIKMYQANDWEISHEEPTHYVLRKNSSTGVGHLVVFLLFWWTFGIANLLYWLFGNKKKKVFK